ncbi:hypothetical protein [Echinicola pacifica]|uniref:hypothetical protein n=1 Tax=Echinicola pacifica TaxID=346377 RepID=UPI00035D5705|nr:hypothetical protein [Echinicola pacifica]
MKLLFPDRVHADYRQKANFRYWENGVRQKEAWFNGESIWDISAENTDPYFMLGR